ncbi:CapA family protein [Pseudoalteromonas agarivorans]|uniref:Uncharacterized protein n=1 Tax=Pseudoalteromonas agarivorans DSM 14585 TaxID=1312369 RepID=A0ACA8DST5_9GAMM|nr:CapA family protein [Pseudoalteromonas agarivorans]ATC81064.1 hypothetical protein PAGA_a0510 [Pseudoalteromonas agarivorans DSM 14585]
MNKFIVGGDFYISDFFYDKKNNYWGELESRINDAEFFFVNVEAPITKSSNAIDKTGPAIRMNADVINCLKVNDNTIATLANNHINDFGSAGVLDTINILNNNDILCIGAGRDIDAASEALEIRINDCKVAIINTCEAEWCGGGAGPGANTINVSRLYSQISFLKAENDFVVVIIHGGSEFYELPSPKRQELYRLLVSFGASAVVSHHTHCISGVEFYKGVPIVYSLGNLLFPLSSPSKEWNNGMLAEFTVSKESGLSLELIPYKFECNKMLQSLNVEEVKHFNEKIQKLNSIILDEIELKRRWDEYCTSQLGSIVNSICLPRSINFIFRKLKLNIKSKGLKFKLLNYLRCETHLDVLSTAIEIESNKRV